MREKEFLPLVKEKLGVVEINDMQRRMLEQITRSGDVVLLSPTGSGKTLAFVMPVLKLLRPANGNVQVSVIAPSRELVLQITGVFRALAHDWRTVALYGGHKMEDEVNELRSTPDILVATPGRLLDHVRRRNVDLLPCRIVVLDEFDKSLELGFEADMSRIFSRLKNVSRIILTSATAPESMPGFLQLNSPHTLNFLKENRELRSRIRVYRVESDGKDKLGTLLHLLANLSESDVIGRTAVFVNHRESAERVARFLQSKGVSAVLYHGAMDQRDREKALMLFRSGSCPVLASTDLGARGLDVEGVKHVVHYHLPLTKEAYTHRNGRTARVKEDGEVYVLTAPQESLPDFISIDADRYLDTSIQGHLDSGMETLYIGAGKKEKLSKGDILGWLTKDCGAEGSAVGRIEVADHYALVSLPKEVVASILVKGSNQRIKGSKKRVERVRL